MTTIKQIAARRQNKAWTWFLDSLKERADEYREQFESVNPEDAIRIAELQFRSQELESIRESPFKGITDE